MKLGEALAARAEATRRIEQLRARIVDNARYQEGEAPSENAADLLGEAEEACAELESLIRRINRTNSVTRLGDGTITDALARRDGLRLRHSVITDAADAAAGRRDRRGGARQLRSELMFLAALPVADLRAQADRIAREIRAVDVAIQRSNWEVDLLD
ncbi:hypothetical protein FHR81_003314 [Actinoalloteichus hoggarensis]|uniref:Uncharacterized protein n=1 Tax=Actinoalloteichus hoggarensis TaxID=1470176 RepID=A0A221W6Z4_9PSEU|nr:DIP1984 family protein [Actinoalloteichus hoggarensis]ASO21668.1 hypothetical protein AHOG_20255 [Actinoalloteichus hoggarensis]MBB5922262.1 hypothetical protein [Actinoalloteichus hoggarensis]